MSNVFEEFYEVLEHVVRTHTNWSQDLSQEEALLRVAAAKVESLKPDVEKTVADADVVVGDVETDVKDGKASLEDLANQAGNTEEAK